MLLHPLSRAALPCVVLPLAAISGQADTTPVRTRTEYLVVGRTETAQVVFEYTANRSATAFRWSTEPQPLVPDADTPTILRATLPITIGGVALAAGTYRLAAATEAGRKLLVATNVEERGATRPTGLRIPLDAREVAGDAGPITLGIRGTRHGADTLVFAYSTSPRASVVDIQMAPGSTFLLVIDHGPWRLTAPVTAR